MADHMYSLNPTTQSQIRVALMLRSIVATQNSANTQFRLLKNKLADFWTLLKLRLQSFKLNILLFYLFFKTFNIRILRWKSYSCILKEFQNTGNSYYLAGLWEWHTTGFINHICDGLQQNRKQVAQAYFEIWTTEVDIGFENISFINVDIFGVFLHQPIGILTGSLSNKYGEQWTR